MTEILYLTHNRLEFVTASLGSLRDNTSLELVSGVSFYDDRSSDGTAAYVDLWSSLMDAELVQGEWNSPVAAMAEFFSRATSKYVAKIDSDVMLPPRWLDDCIAVLEAHPEVDVLGIEARGESAAEAAPSGVVRLPDPSSWIGGIGVFRLEAIQAAMARRPLVCDRATGKWFGWQPFQELAGLRAAWLRPSLQVFLLDRLPMEPWRSLSDSYASQGWQRPAPYRYGPEWAGLWNWWQ